MNSDQNGPIISELFRGGQIYVELEKYLVSCSPNTPDEEYVLSARDSNKSSRNQAVRDLPFPNLA